MQQTNSVVVKILALIALLLLSGCYKKEQWKEEVLLNTGETISLTRQIKFVLASGYDNPLKFSYRAGSWEKTTFKWANKTYIYDGSAGFQILAISPRQQPVLLRVVHRSDVSEGHKCSTPSYIAFEYMEANSNWTTLEKIEPWLYLLPSNLLMDLAELNNLKSSYTQREKEEVQLFLRDPRNKSLKMVDPNYAGENCK